MNLKKYFFNSTSWRI